MSCGAHPMYKSINQSINQSACKQFSAANKLTHPMGPFALDLIGSSIPSQEKQIANRPPLHDLSYAVPFITCNHPSLRSCNHVETAIPLDVQRNAIDTIPKGKCWLRRPQMLHVNLNGTRDVLRAMKRRPRCCQLQCLRLCEYAGLFLFAPGVCTLPFRPSRRDSELTLHPHHPCPRLPTLRSVHS